MTLTKATYSLIDGAPANVLDFGADPTGVADSSAAFLAAMTAASNIYVPEGTYCVDAGNSLRLSYYERNWL
jgi:polygalacturonase